MYTIRGYVSVCAPTVPHTLEKDGIIPRLEILLFFRYLFLFIHVYKFHKRCTILVRLGVCFFLHWFRYALSCTGLPFAWN